MRVVLASERPSVQNLLTDLVEKEPGAVVVGQAENAFGALGLVENSRPDVVIIDSNLPYSFGIDGVALSRMSGLDTAQLICQTMPGTRVIVINNLDSGILSQPPLSQNSQAVFSRDRGRGNTTFKLEEIYREAALPEGPLFANVEVKAWSATQQNNDSGPVASGAISIGGGLYLIGTIWLAPYGVLLVLGGLIMLAFGLLKKMITRLSQKAGGQ